jgi:ABC-type lipoprotein export system ATPase subunit
MADSFTLRLHQVLPTPLAGRGSNTIWQQDISLTSGRNYQILAPSGTGKSTLIGILNGIRKDYSGDVFLGNENLSKASLDRWVEIRRKYISTVFQDLRLFDQLTAAENISLSGGFEEPAFSKDQVLEWCVRLQIEGKLHDKVGQLSYGQKQRVALLRALNRKFSWLLLDEPFSHLDVDNMRIAFELIKDQCKEQQAGLIVTGLDHRFNQDEFITLEI